MSSNRHRCFIVRTTLVEGKPDLKFPSYVSYRKTGYGRWHAGWREHFMDLEAKGFLDGKIVCTGIGNTKALLYLQNNFPPNEAMLLVDAWQIPALKAWLIGQGISDCDGKPVADIVYSGDSAYAVGSDEQE